MANALAALDPILWSAAYTVPREMTGAITAVNRDWDDKQVALNDTTQSPTVKVAVAPAGTESSYSPSMAGPSITSDTPTAVSVTLDYNKYDAFNLTGEQERNLTENSGVMMDYFGQQIQQKIRALVNAAEARLFAHLYQNSSRATGTAGTAPFGSGLGDAANCRRILVENGAPMNDRTIVLNPAGAASVLSNTQLTKANEAGTIKPLRSGAFLDVHGFQFTESAYDTVHTKGTGTSYATAAAEPKGETSIAVDTGSGTVLAGDIVTFAGDTVNKYVVNTGITEAGSLVLGNPGLRAAVADEVAMTVGANFTPNLALQRGACVMSSRAPEIPVGGQIVETRQFGDPESGLGFLLVKKVGDGLTEYRVHILYGFKVIQSEFIVTLLG